MGRAVWVYSPDEAIGKTEKDNDETTNMHRMLGALSILEAGMYVRLSAG